MDELFHKMCDAFDVRRKSVGRYITIRPIRSHEGRIE